MIDQAQLGFQGSEVRSIHVTRADLLFRLHGVYRQFIVVRSIHALIWA